jgi:general secretion pathway protein C
MTPRQATLGVDIFTGLVIASVAVSLAGLSWRLMGATGAPAQSPAPPRMAQAAPDSGIAPILAAAPFGRAAMAGAAPATGLGIELKGVILAEPRAASSVLIANAGGSARSYRIGDALPGGAVIENIEANNVLLRVNGRAAVLGFQRTPQMAAAAVETVN